MQMFNGSFKYLFSAQLKPNGELDFRPTAEFPALQYLDSIDPGSAADRAGLKPGDFILEVNHSTTLNSFIARTNLLTQEKHVQVK